MESLRLNPVNTPAPKGRAASWAAWYSSLLKKYEGKVPKQRSFTEAFTKALEKNKRGTTLSYYILDTRPNRGEIQFKLRSGELIWCQIVNPLKVGDHSMPWDLARDCEINPVYEFYRERQKKLWDHEERPNYGLKLPGRNLFDNLWAEEFLPFEEGYEAPEGQEEEIPRWTYYVHMFNALPVQVNLRNLTDPVLRTIYMTMQMHSVDHITYQVIDAWLSAYDYMLRPGDCAELIALSLGYGCYAEIHELYKNGSVPNKRFKE